MPLVIELRPPIFFFKSVRDPKNTAVSEDTVSCLRAQTRKPSDDRCSTTSITGQNHTRRVVSALRPAGEGGLSTPLTHTPASPVWRPAAAQADTKLAIAWTLLEAIRPGAEVP